jgi:hypothetical protein
VYGLPGSDREGRVRPRIGTPGEGHRLLESDHHLLLPMDLISASIGGGEAAVRQVASRMPTSDEGSEVPARSARQRADPFEDSSRLNDPDWRIPLHTRAT